MGMGFTYRQCRQSKQRGERDGNGAKMPRIVITKKENTSDRIQVEHQHEQDNDVHDGFQPPDKSCHDHAQLRHLAEHLGQSHKAT